MLKDRFHSFMVFLGLAEDDFDDDYSRRGADVDERYQPARMETPEPVASPWATTSEPVVAPTIPRSSSVSVLDGYGQAQPGAGRPLMRPAPSTSSVRPITTLAAEGDLDAFVPRSYDDSKRIGDELRARRSLVVNLSGADPELSRRITDFASGVVYTLGGKIRRIDHHIYLLSPSDVRVSPEAIERLRQRGFRPVGE